MGRTDRYRSDITVSHLTTPDGIYNSAVANAVCVRILHERPTRQGLVLSKTPVSVELMQHAERLSRASIQHVWPLHVDASLWKTSASSLARKERLLHDLCNAYKNIIFVTAVMQLALQKPGMLFDIHHPHSCLGVRHQDPL